MTAINTNAPAANTFDAIIAKATEQGRITAAGVDGIMGLAVVVFEGAHAKVVDKDNVKDVYKAYLLEANGAKFANRVAVDDKTLKFGVSKLNRFVKLATVTPGSKREKINLITQAARIIRADTKDKKVVGSTYELIGRIVGRANKDKKVGVSDQVIREWLAPEPKDKGDEVLEALRALLAKAEGFASREEPGFLVNSKRFSDVAQLLNEQLESYKRENSQQEDGGEDDGEDLAGALSEVLQAAE